MRRNSKVINSTLWKLCLPAWDLKQWKELNWSSLFWIKRWPQSPTWLEKCRVSSSAPSPPQKREKSILNESSQQLNLQFLSEYKSLSYHLCSPIVSTAADIQRKRVLLIKHLLREWVYIKSERENGEKWIPDSRNVHAGTLDMHIYAHMHSAGKCGRR